MQLYQVTKIHLHKDDPLYSYCDHFAHLAKCLYNASLFRIRQVFTGWDKTPEQRSTNETEIFEEIRLLQQVHPSIRVHRIIGYGHLEKLMRVTADPDFFSGLPMQTAQNTVRQACRDFSNWLKALKDWKQHPEKYLGKPCMPRYKKSEVCTCTFTNQDAVLSPLKEGSYALKLPLTRERLPVGNVSLGRLKEVRATPWYGEYIVTLTMEREDVPLRTDLPETAAIDFGTDNIAAFVCTDHSSVIYKGGAVMAGNQWFAKRRAELAGILTKGHEHMHASSARLTGLSKHHACFSLDQLHKISRDIIRRCLEHRAGTLVLGVNRYWKQNAGMGRVGNQKFTAVPIALLRQLITYKAAMAGLVVIEQEESYTSKADITAMDRIPVYGTGDTDVRFSGRRICRGLYRCADGLTVNADCLAAANIMRKAFPDIWGRSTDFRFLAVPEVSGFHELNPSGIPVKRIAAV